MIETTAVNVQILDGGELQTALTKDLKRPGNVFGWQYLIKKEFLHRLLSGADGPGKVSFIVDNRMSTEARDLQAWLPRFSAWRWSYNRTMHDKTWIFPQDGVVYLGSHNLTRGSYWLSVNRSVRIASHQITEKLMHQWDEDRQRAIKIQTAKP